ncbi:MAG: amidohydrolase family protein [Steroidobacteraceae bacterium]
MLAACAIPCAGLPATARAATPTWILFRRSSSRPRVRCRASATAPRNAEAVRYQIKDGADVIKFMASGGVLSLTDAVDNVQLTQEEMNAIVSEAHAWGRKAAAHCHGDRAAKMAIAAGVDSIEHAVKIGTPIAMGTDAGVEPHGRNVREFELMAAGRLVVVGRQASAGVAGEPGRAGDTRAGGGLAGCLAGFGPAATGAILT